MGKDEPMLNQGHPTRIDALPMALARAYKPYMPQIALEVYVSSAPRRLVSQSAA